ncbi:MAG: PRC-barrel domain protein [Nocardioides sp.]|jgi:uncharacterized protein (TIGR02271 family)|nr:PRC-barrel domain protein [Nocardioides sp.]
MLNDTQLDSVIGSTAYSSTGDKIGKVGQVFLDDNTGQPEFVTVNTGLFGTSESYVPVAQASYEGDRLTLPYTKDQIKDAPHVDVANGHLDETEEQRLYSHYGLTWNSTDTGYADTTATGVDHTVGHDTSGPTTDDAMTRSEEHLEVGKTSHEAGRARLRKYVTSHTETETVPVARERAVVEREPVTGGNIDQALDGPAISEEEHEVVLHEEEAVVSKTTTPVERVRLGTETVVEDETVSAEVREENIEVEGDVRDGR